MPFVENAQKFFEEQSKDAKQAELIFQQFQEEEFNLDKIKPALLYLSRFSQDFSLSLNSQMILQKVKKTFENPHQLGELTSALYGLTECGFSARHFSDELRNFFIEQLFTRLEERDQKYSSWSRALQIETIAGLTALKNLGLLENADEQLKEKISQRLYKLAESQIIKDLPDYTIHALKDFSAYCKILLNISKPNFSNLPSSPKQNLPTQIEYKVSNAVRKYLGVGVGREAERWNHGKGYERPVEETREEFSYQVGKCRLSFESNILDDRHATDMMVFYKSRPRRSLAIEVDGKRWHKAFIDGEWVTNGKTQARNRNLELITGQKPLIIEQEDFWHFDGSEKVALEFLDQFEQLQKLSQWNGQDAEIFEDPKVETEGAKEVEAKEVEVKQEEDFAEPNPKVELSEVAVSTQKAAEPDPEAAEPAAPAAEAAKKKKSKSKKKITIQDRIVQMLESGMNAEDMEEYINKSQPGEFVLTPEIVTQTVERENIKALIMLRRYANLDEKYVNAVVQSNNWPRIVKVFVSYILHPGEMNFHSEDSSKQHHLKNKFHAQLEQANDANIVKHEAYLNQAVERSELAVTADLMDLYEFNTQLHFGDFFSTLVAAAEKNEIWKLRLAFLKGKVPPLAWAVVKECLTHGNLPSCEVVCLCMNVSESREINTIYIDLCSHIIAQGDVQYAQKLFQYIKEAKIEVDQKIKNQVLQKLIIANSNPQLIEIFMNAGAKIMCSRNEEEMMGRLCESGNISGLELVLNEMKKDKDYKEKISDFEVDRTIKIGTVTQKKKYNLFYCAVRSAPALEFLLDHGMTIHQNYAADLLTLALEEKKFDSFDLIQQRAPTLLSERVIKEVTQNFAGKTLDEETSKRLQTLNQTKEVRSAEVSKFTSGEQITGDEKPKSMKRS